jgi:hypothetical protein
LGEKISIWPFQEIKSSSQIILTEIYPRLFWNKAGLHNKKVRDVSDLNAALYHFKSKPVLGQSHLNDHNTDAIITAAGMRDVVQSGYARTHHLFNIPDDISDIVGREGWIFGVNTRGISL